LKKGTPDKKGSLNAKKKKKKGIEKSTNMPEKGKETEHINEKANRPIEKISLVSGVRLCPKMRKGQKLIALHESEEKHLMERN